MAKSTPNHPDPPEDLISAADAAELLRGLWIDAPATGHDLNRRNREARFCGAPDRAPPAYKVKIPNAGGPEQWAYSHSGVVEWFLKYKLTPLARARYLRGAASMPRRDPPEGAFRALAFVEPEGEWCLATRPLMAADDQWSFRRLRGRLWVKRQRPIAWLPIPDPPPWAEGEAP